MLPEILLYATAVTNPEARRLGLVGDAVALWSRAHRCRAAWAPHEARCRAAVLASVSGLARRRTALVLGSGLLRDIAFPDMLQSFERVILVDAVHLWPARRRSRHPRATRVVADLTNWAAPLACGGSAPPDPDSLEALERDPKVDFVLSANVLSQLPMAVARSAARGRTTGVAAESAAIVNAHLTALLRFDARICLLTDIRHRELARDGTILRETDLMHGAVLPTPDDAWDWEVAPPGEVSRGARHMHRVHAYRDLRAAQAHDLSAKAP